MSRPETQALGQSAPEDPPQPRQVRLGPIGQIPLDRLVSVADQFLSSIQNFALTLITARAVTAHEFGAFSIAIIVYVLIIGLTQAGVGEAALLTLHSLATRHRHRNQVASVVTGILLGVLLGGLLALIALPTPHEVRHCLLALAVALPVLIGHDCARFAFVAAEQGRHALIADSAWVLAWIVTLIVTSPTTPAAAVLAWGLSSAAGLLYSLWRIGGPWPGFAQLRTAVAADALLRYRLVGEYLAINAGSQLTVLGYSAAAGLTMGGAVRGAQSLLGPLNTLFNALRIVLTPTAARSYQKNGLRSMRLPIVLGAVMVGVALPFGVVLLLLPTSVGQELLGDTWTLTRNVLPIIVLHRILTALGMGPLSTLRAAGQGGKMMVFRGGAELIGGVACVLTTIVAGPWWGLLVMLATPLMDAGSVWYLLIRARRVEHAHS